MKIRKIRVLSAFTSLFVLFSLFGIFQTQTVSANYSVLHNKYEAEDAILTNCIKYNENGSYSGTGVVAYFNTLGDVITFDNLYVSEGGAYNIAYRYSQQLSANQKISLWINDDTTPTKLDFTSTGTWNTTWNTIVSTAYLKPGNNRIKLSVENGDGAINLDYIMLVPNLYEAEESYVYDATKCNDGSGYSGSGQVAYFYRQGSYIKFNIDVPASGTYNLHYRYCNGASNHTVSLYINDTYSKKLSFSPTGTWSESWGTLENRSYLNKGANTVTLKMDSGDDAINLDYVLLEADDGTNTPNDLSDDKYFPRVIIQNNNSSCVPIADVYYLYNYEVAKLKNINNYNFYQPNQVASPVWPLIANGTESVLNETGGVSLANVPYNNSNDPTIFGIPTAESAMKNALQYRLDTSDPDYQGYGNDAHSGSIKGYRNFYIDCRTNPTPIKFDSSGNVIGNVLDIVKNEIKINKKPIRVIMPTTHVAIQGNYSTRDAIIVKARANGSYNHALVIVGFDDNKTCVYNGYTFRGAFKVINPHGNFLWVMYDALNRVSAVMPNDSDRQSIFSSQGCNQFTTMKVKNIQPELTASITVNTTKLANFRVSFSASNFGETQTATYTPKVTDFNTGSLLSSNYRAFDGNIATANSYQERTFTYDISKFKDYDQIHITITDNTGNPINLSNGYDAVTTIKRIKIKNNNNIVLLNDAQEKTIDNNSITFSYILGLYSIKNSGNFQYLDALADTQGTGLSTALKSQNSSQYWKIEPSNGGFQFIPMSNQTYVMDLCNAWNAENNTVNVGAKTGYTNAQTWAITNTSGKYQIRPFASATRYLSAPLSAGGRPVISSVENDVRKWEFTLYQRGDINCNGMVDATDSEMLMYHLQKYRLLNSAQQYLADLDGNGAIEYNDYLIMSNIISE